MNEGFSVLGAGPAGAAAALALRRAGERVVLHEKSRLPRHKVCGEFFSPEILPLLEEFGLAAAFRAQRPARVTHAELHFGRGSLRFRLPEPAWGLSRWAFDHLLLRAALDRGAILSAEPPRRPAVVAAGRRTAVPRGRRLFGFKAHFSGPANDAVELYFFAGGYCGLCPVQGGVTNVCGLADESMLARIGFQVDRLLGGTPRLRERLALLERRINWLVTGPLCFGPAAAAPAGLAAGDARCFVDPFTGSGLLAAVRTGSWAGEALAGGPNYEARCRDFYRRQLSTTAILRRALRLGLLERLAAFLPGPLLFRLTRPRLP
jgi:flavin-dependent dehydrogenase